MARTLSDAEKEKLVTLYNGRFEKKGRDVSTVGWGSIESQLLRFEMITRGLDLDGKSILDVGCGLGDLATFLGKNVNTFRYTGIDVATRLIEDARSAHKAEHISFISGDFLQVEPLGTYDFVFCSGSLNYRFQENEELARSFILKMTECAEEAVSINFLSTYVDFEQPINYHYSPEKLFEYAKALSDHVSLFHDYSLREFTIQIRMFPITR